MEQPGKSTLTVRARTCARTHTHTHTHTHTQSYASSFGVQRNTLSSPSMCLLSGLIKASETLMSLFHQDLSLVVMRELEVED